MRGARLSVTKARLMLFGGVALALAAAAAAFVPPPAASDAKVRKGVQAWEAGDHAAAVAIWRPLAEAGDGDAQFNLAQAYRLGQGVAADQTLAFNWYQRSAASGHPVGQANYGLILFEKGQRQAAMPWLAQAAEKGDARAQYVYGTALFNGDHVQKDWAKAYAMMSRAADSGLAPAVTSREEMDKYVPVGDRQKGLALAAKLPSLSFTSPTAAGMASRPAATPVKASAPAPRPTPAASPPRPVVPVAASANGSWRVQLGAYSNEDRARSLWNRLRGEVPQLAALQPYFVKVGSVTRLQGGPIASKSDADAACAGIKATGQDCFAIRP
jgi:cell division septation protein DedD